MTSATGSSIATGQVTVHRKQHGNKMSPAPSEDGVAAGLDQRKRCCGKIDMKVQLITHCDYMKVCNHRKWCPHMRCCACDP